MLKHCKNIITLLAGMIFLLHMTVPHHHHADLASLIEHQRIIEHEAGMHDHNGEHEEHHHHEELLCEADMSVEEDSSQVLRAIIKMHKLQKQSDKTIVSAHFIEHKPSLYTSDYIAEWNYVPPSYFPSIHLSFGLRAPPTMV